jgi:hypothetical protein
MQNEKGTIQQAEVQSRGGTNKTGATNGVRREVPAWWLAVPQSEKAVIRDVVASIRGLKRSKSPQISQAARKWERGIVCFIRFRLMGERPRPRGKWSPRQNGSSPLPSPVLRTPSPAPAGEGRAERTILTSSPASERSRQGVSQGRG